jgi:hypothetical protein
MGIKTDKGYKMACRLDTMLTPGQKVRVHVNVDIAYDLDIREYLEDSDEPDITVEELVMDIEDNQGVKDILDEHPDADVTNLIASITKIL